VAHPIHGKQSGLHQSPYPVEQLGQPVPSSTVPDDEQLVVDDHQLVVNLPDAGARLVLEQLHASLA
jgi:hypothetical protein